MKLIWVLGVLMLAFGSPVAQAQEVSYRKSTIFVGGEPYAYLLKHGSAWAREYSFQNLKKKELIAVKPITKKLADGYDYIYYEVIFKGLNVKTEMQDDDNLARHLAYDLASFRVLQNDSLNREAVQRFLEKYPARRFSTRNFIAR